MDIGIVLHLTGTFHLLDQAEGSIGGLSRRAQAMLAYLACQPGMRAERGLLADLLWSDRAEEQARASLRQELAVLRRALPDGVMHADRQIVWLDPVRVRIKGGTGGAEFLKGFDLGSEGFEDWLREMRAQDAAIEITPAPSASPHSRPAVAVLPFAELGVADTDMFADGVVEEITGALSRVRDFHVIARQSAFALQGDRLTVPDTARKLGVQYLVEGTVRRAGDRVRITAQLVHGMDGRTLWSERFDDHLDDLFDLQDRIAARIAGQISPTLRDAEIRRASAIPPDQQSAYSLTLQALPQFWTHSFEANQRAIAQFDAALANSPDYYPAMAYKAWALAQAASYMWSDDPAGNRAVALDLVRICAPHSNAHAPSMVALSAAAFMSDARIEQPLAMARNALAIDPNNAWGWLRLGFVTLRLNEPDHAIDSFNRAEALSPLDPFLFNMRFGKSMALYQQGHLSEAIDLVQATLRTWPDIGWVYRELTSYLMAAGRPDEAESAARKLMHIYPGITVRRIRDCSPPALDGISPGLFQNLAAAGIPEK